MPKAFPEVSTTCNIIQVPKPCESHDSAYDKNNVPKPCVSHDPAYDQSNDVSNRHCNCPACQKPPPAPINLPIPAIGTNHARLQEYLLDYYKSSTFNTCKHQTLPLMEGSPMKLMVDPDATLLHIIHQSLFHFTGKIKSRQDWTRMLDQESLNRSPGEPVIIIIIIIMYLYSAQYLHILQDSKRYLTNPTVQVQPQLTSN